MSKSITRIVRSALNIAASFNERVADLRAALPRDVVADKAALFDAPGCELKLRETIVAR